MAGLALPPLDQSSPNLVSRRYFSRVVGKGFEGGFRVHFEARTGVQSFTCYINVYVVIA